MWLLKTAQDCKKRTTRKENVKKLKYRDQLGRRETVLNCIYLPS